MHVVVVEINEINKIDQNEIHYSLHKKFASSKIYFVVCDWEFSLNEISKNRFVFHKLKNICTLFLYYRKLN